LGICKHQKVDNPRLNPFTTEVGSPGDFGSFSTYFNILFFNIKYFFSFRCSPDNPEEVRDVVILDLQSTKVRRLGLELATLFCSSTSPQQRKGHFDELLRHYYETFFRELRSLGDDSKPFFSFDDLKEEYDECYLFGFALGFSFLSVG
jgi:hypothetical protein